MTNHGGARKGAGRPPRPTPKAYPIWCGQMAEEHRALILERLTPDERFDALMDAARAKGEREMIEKELAVMLITSEGVATIRDYGNSVRRYREALIELAEENDWLHGIDRAELRKWLTHYLTE